MRIVLEGEVLWILREAGRTGLPRMTLAPGASAVWDRRFSVQVSGDCREGLRLGPLGEAGLAAIGGRAAIGLPRPACLTVPAVFDGEAPVAVPELDLWPGLPRGCVTLAPRTILSWLETRPPAGIKPDIKQ